MELTLSNISLPSKEQSWTASFAKAYVMQYVSLIIIILTFTVGSFATKSLSDIAAKEGVKTEITQSQDLVVKAETLPASQNKILANTELLSTLYFYDLASPQDAAFDADKMEALKEFLSQHDVIANFYLWQGKDLLAAYRQATNLRNALKISGIMESEYKITLAGFEIPADGNAKGNPIKMKLLPVN